MTPIFETHAHYEDKQFDKDRDELLLSMHRNQIRYIVNVGSSLETTRKTIDLTRQYDFIYGAAGVHPSETAELTEENFSQIREAALQPKIVAVGEIGLDYYWPEPDHDTQKKWFIRQLNLAREIHKPVIIHSRDAAQDTMDIMKEQRAEEIGGVVHCFSGSLPMAQEYVKMGFFIGIGGVVTFKNARKLKEVAEGIPMEAIVLETDSPYLAPVPHRGKRNCSLYIPLAAQEIARIKGISAEEVIQKAYENARRLYRFPKEW